MGLGTGEWGWELLSCPRRGDGTTGVWGRGHRRCGPPIPDTPGLDPDPILELCSGS